MSSTCTPSSVVVGFDGSPPAQVALQVAAEEAQRRRRPLHVVTAIGVRPDDVVSTAAQALAATHPGLEISTCVRTSAPSVLLLQEARDAVLLVVGARGAGGFAGLTLGSVAEQLTSHAPCPVLVARRSEGHDGPEGDGRPVVVGIDGSGSCGAAVAFAFEAADARRVPLTAVHAYVPWAYDPSTGVAGAQGEQGVADQHVALASAALAGLSERYPDVRTEVVLRRLPPSGALVGASADAQLLVVGSRGLGGFRGLLLGSVSRAVVHHAVCSVVVVRATP